MFLKNVKTFLNHLRRNKLYAFITIFGFAVSLMFVILLGVYIKNELSVDNFHVNKDRIYRLASDEWAGFAPPSGPLLKEKFPEIESYTRIMSLGGTASVKENEKVLYTTLLADSVFFKMFSFPLLEGNPETVLQEKNSMVITQSFALKLFGKLPEIGAPVKINSGLDFKVTGIMEDFPENTHFRKVDCIMDFPTIASIWNYPDILTTYNNNSFGLYLIAHKNADLQAKVPQMLESFKEVNWMYKRGYATKLVAEPLSKVYFSAKSGQGIKQNSMTRIKILSVIVLLILLLSVINYINLTISQAGGRSKQAAIRKLLGGRKWSFVLQFIDESIILCLFSLLLAVGISQVAEPTVNHLLNTELHLRQAFTWQFWMIAVLFTVFVGILSGILPALKIASFDPIAVVKGTFRMKEKRIYSRILIGFQYMIIIALMISAAFVQKQTRFMQNFDLGFNKENLISISNSLSPKQQGAFKSKIMQYPGVAHVCFVKGSPLDGGNNNSFTQDGKNLSFQTFEVDTSFFSMMDIGVKLTGMAYADSALLINQVAVKALELPDMPLSAKIYNTETPVYGVVDDFHFRDLHTAIGPANFFIFNAEKSSGWSILIKLNGQNTFETIEKIKQTYADFTGGIQIEPEFFDKTIEQWYAQEEKLAKIIFYFTLLTIIISVMGLFAMSLYYVQQKTKEIGVRKVNGATVGEILKMLNKDFVKWVLIAYVIAAPIAYYAMNRWLENFAYKTALSWWIFVLAGLSAIAIALLTVSWQSFRAANRNPVKALRYE